MNIEQALPLLGGLSPSGFMRTHWQRKPLLIRQAVPQATPPLTRAALFALAARDDVESRLIDCGAGDWRMKRGPFSRRALPPVGRAGWTLLVQGLDLHVDAARDLLDRFRFIPDARLDDVMLSWASDGGGVGPHVDSYDVFLLQVTGTRRWRTGRVRSPAWIPGLPLKVLADFEPTQEDDLHAGDMLYLPPGWGHDGVAVGECMTASIGFRAPSADECASALLARALDWLDDDEPGLRYRDPGLAASAEPGRVPDGLSAFALQSLQQALNRPGLLACALGEWLSEPKPKVWFERGRAPVAGEALCADRRTRLLYDAGHVFINGESFAASGRDARVLQRLADVRRVSARELAALSDAARALVHDWACAGWLRPVAPAGDARE